MNWQPTTANCTDAVTRSLWN